MFPERLGGDGEIEKLIRAVLFPLFSSASTGTRGLKKSKNIRLLAILHIDLEKIVHTIILTNLFQLNWLRGKLRKFLVQNIHR